MFNKNDLIRIDMGKYRPLARVLAVDQKPWGIFYQVRLLETKKEIRVSHSRKLSLHKSVGAGSGSAHKTKLERGINEHF